MAMRSRSVYNLTATGAKAVKLKIDGRPYVKIIVNYVGGALHIPISKTGSICALTRDQCHFPIQFRSRHRSLSYATHEASFKPNKAYQARANGCTVEITAG